jgi:1-acyl-sn-glycerol-3-phosphate acyltransferase
MRDPQGERMSWFYHFSVWCSRLLLNSLSRWRVSGLERVPLRGPLLVVSNHQNNADPPIIVSTIPRAVHCMAKQEIFDSAIETFARLYGAFAVRRGEPDRQAIRVALDFLAKGSCVALFPEGTRSRTGHLNQAHPGAGLIALRSAAPVLPVAIVGTGELKSARAVFGRPRIEVRIGEPFSLPRNDDGQPITAVQATDFMMRRIAALLPREMQGYYAEQPAAAVPRRVG